MNSIDLIKTEIMSLYKINPRIHVNIFLRNPKIYLRNTPAVIKAVYEVVYILFHTGMRISEFCGLIISDIDFEHHQKRSFWEKAD